MNSVLNPEAPEFYPHLTTVTQGGYRCVHKSIRTSNTLPTGLSYELFKTFPDFKILTCHLSENVVAQSNHIIATELPGARLKSDNHVYNTDVVADANDSFMDRINTNVDTACGVNRPGYKYVTGTHTQSALSAWNHAPVISKIQVGSTTLLGAKNVPRPQLNFKDKIDNSENLWVPKISDKPNELTPLALNILYNDEGEAVGYEHPYKVELDIYQAPAYALDPEPCLPFPEPLENTNFTFVDTEAKLDALVEHLATVDVLAVDLEHHSYRTYQGITCLIQITTHEGGDFIIDALAIREHIHKLNIAFTDPKMVKVLHGAEYDVIWLQRDFGVYIVGLFDTHQAAKVLNLAGLSLKYLLQKYCNIDADKKYQLADWRIRPLPEELIQYARMDTHYLLYIWRKMKEELLQAGGSDDYLLMTVFDNSRQICEATYNKQVVTESSHLPLYARSRKSFNTQQMAALKMLYKWRDTQARMLDESTTYLLPQNMLLSLAETLPREIQGVNAVCHPMPPFVKQNLLAIHKMILSCRELPNQPQLYKMPTHLMNTPNTQQTICYDVHDIYPTYSENHGTGLESTVDLYSEYGQSQPSTPTAIPVEPKPVVSHLNAEAVQFVPPFDRYRHYRVLAQIEEMNELKEREAKIAAIGKGNELIKTEVLKKVQQAQSQIAHEKKIPLQKTPTQKTPAQKTPAQESPAQKTPAQKIPATITSATITTAQKTAGSREDIIDLLEPTTKKTQQRKRKITAEKAETKESVDSPEHNTKQTIDADSKKSDNIVKPYRYKNVDYKKFHSDTNKDHKQKQPKMKYKKHKK